MHRSDGLYVKIVPKQGWMASWTHDQLVGFRVLLADVVLFFLVRNLHALPNRVEQNPVVLPDLSPIHRFDESRSGRHVLVQKLCGLPIDASPTLHVSLSDEANPHALLLAGVGQTHLLGEFSNLRLRHFAHREEHAGEDRSVDLRQEIALIFALVDPSQ